MSETVTGVTITVPAVDGEEAARATDLMERLVERYQISRADADALFNACVAIYLRGRIALGDRASARCALADAADDPNP